MAFGQTIRHQFINYDDDSYVYANPNVTAGLTRRGIVWAFTFAEIGHWHPVTWFSHMLDCQVYGRRAGGHHLTNVILHASAAILLFLALKQMTVGPGSPRDESVRLADRTGSIWRSAFVAALFAIHPLRVESVAWVSERKDVLSGVFFMLTILAYVRYVRKARSTACYLLVVILFALGLMSKGILVTLPFVLLLLDYWPLGRVTPDTLESIWKPEKRTAVLHLIAEKIPLFLLSAGSCIATYLSPEKIAPALREPFAQRMGNAVVSYVIYLKQMFYPAGLVLPYFNPPGGFPMLQVAFAVALLIGISIGALIFWKTHPYLIVGWLWYLGMMVPVIGIIQISYYARADRYTYLSHIGLYLSVTWGTAELFTRWRPRRELFAVATLAVITLLIVRTRAQAAYWHDSETLWRYVLANTPQNYVAHNNLGLAFEQNGQSEAATAHFEKALQIQPAYMEAHNNLGNSLARTGHLNEAIAHYQKAMDLMPGQPQVHNNLGSALAQNGQLVEAIEQFQKALEINPDFAGAHGNLGYAFFQIGQSGKAIAHYQSALRIEPNRPQFHNNLGSALAQNGQPAAAIAHFQKAVEIDPNFVEAHLNLAMALSQNSQWAGAIAHYRDAIRLEPGAVLIRSRLAWLLATVPDEKLRNGSEAVLLAKESCERTENPDTTQLDTLAAAYAELRDFSAARETASRALGKAKAVGDNALSQQIEQRLELYRHQQPYRQPANGADMPPSRR